MNDLDTEVEKLINALLANSPAALKASKQLIRDVANREVDEELMNHTSDVIAQLRASPEGQEGLGAFFEKRPASWRIDADAPINQPGK